MRRRFVVRLADVNIGIISKSNLKNMCRDYLVHDKPKFWISVTNEELQTKARQTIRNYYEHNRCYCVRSVEALAVYDKLSIKMLEYNAFMLHAAVVAVDGEGYAFLALSGTGKSTHASLWLQYFENRAFMVNGDKPLIRVMDNHVYAYGTPWCGKEQLNTNTRVPLKAIFFLERGQETIVTKMPSRLIPQRIVEQMMIPNNGKERARLFELVDRMLSMVEIYRLSCDMSPDTARIAWESIQGEQAK